MTTTTSVDYVDATFGGRAVRFRIRPGRIMADEALNGPLMSRLNRLRAGAWSLSDLTSTLAAGHPQWMAAGPAIDAAIAKNRPGTYAPLAQLILAAALVGIPESEAHFDEAAE